MKSLALLNHKEKAQVLPLVALMMIAIIGMVALIIDGGSLMSNKRTAQAAADAGALAGAQRLCEGYKDAQNVAIQYASSNKAINIIVTVVNTRSTMTVTVENDVENDSFFARIFGKDKLLAHAIATAGCYGPKGASVLPIGWNCRAPTTTGESSMECQIQTINWSILKPLVGTESVDSIYIETDGKYYSRDYHSDNKTDNKSIIETNSIDPQPPKELYIILDQIKTCIEDDPTNGAIVCDPDKDGKKEVLVSGDRGFLYLTKDTNDICKWVTNPPTFIQKVHSWLSDKPGSPMCQDKMIEYNFVGTIKLVPVYNYFCAGDPRNPSVDNPCMVSAHESPWPAEPVAGDDFTELKPSNGSYHILTFQPFYITCISNDGNCPGLARERSMVEENPDIKPSVKAKTLQDLSNAPVIEGFFLTGVDPSSDYSQTCPLKLGNCTVSLYK